MHREKAKLLLLKLKQKTIEHFQVKDLPAILGGRYHCVFNNSKVIPVKVFGRRATGGRVEFLLTRRLGQIKMVEEIWQAMAKSSRPLKPKENIDIAPGVQFVIQTNRGGGHYDLQIKFSKTFTDWRQVLENVGAVPLPPYIRENPLDVNHRQTYQTVYAREEGSVAAPTAGFHFTPELLKQLETEDGISFVTLHVGPGTFLPIRSNDIREHQMHSERYWLEEKTARTIQQSRQEKSGILAVGTTSVRVLESCWQESTKSLQAGHGETSLFIYPGYHFKAVDAMLTNFHLPGSTLLLLVSALTGREFLLKAYQQAIEQGYRFYSYGDAMLILPE